MTDRTLRPLLNEGPSELLPDRWSLQGLRTSDPTDPVEPRSRFHRSNDRSDVAALVRSLYAGPPLGQRSLPASGSHRSVAVAATEATVETDTTATEDLAVVAIEPSSAFNSPAKDAQLQEPRAEDRCIAEESTEMFLARRLRTAEFVILPNTDFAYRTVKRTVDLVGALLLLVLSLPLFALLVLLIRLDSPGPAIFRQTRVTRNGRHFTFFKFRTMYADARERFPEHYRFDQTVDSEDVFYKLADDPRNTRMGRWLRRTTLDELPNLLNVLKGEISLVGPRPDLPELVRRYSDLELSCLLTKAGLTGCAQTRGRSLLTMKERLRFDLYYVSHQSTWLDVKLLVRTVLVVLLRRGAF